MIIFDSATIYIQSATTLADKIAKIDRVIDALEDLSLTAAANENITEYTLDDGQTKISQIYRGVEAIQRSINAYEAIRQRYINRLNGRGVRLVDGKNFTKNTNGRF